MLDDPASISRLLGTLAPGAALPVLLTRAPKRPLEDTPEAALKSEKRRAIMRHVRKAPGLPISKLRALMEMGQGVFFHHLRKLTRSGLVETREMGTRTRVFPAGKAPLSDLGPLEEPSVRKVASAYLKKPGRTTAQIAAIVGLTQRMTQRHVRTLVDAGYLVQEEGWPPTFTPTAKLEEALRQK